MESTMEIGVDYNEFTRRLVDFMSSGKAAIPEIENSKQKSKIIDLLTALQDAQILWGYEIASGKDRLQFAQNGNVITISSLDDLQLNARWRDNLSALFEKYGFSNQTTIPISDPSPIVHLGDRNMLLFDRAIKRIFSYSEKIISDLEDNSKQ